MGSGTYVLLPNIFDEIFGSGTSSQESLMKQHAILCMDYAIQFFPTHMPHVNLPKILHSNYKPILSPVLIHVVGFTPKPPLRHKKTSIILTPSGTTWTYCTRPSMSPSLSKHLHISINNTIIARLSGVLWEHKEAAECIDAIYRHSILCSINGNNIQPQDSAALISHSLAISTQLPVRLNFIILLEQDL